MVEVGQSYYYKLNSKRGRPFVGEAVRRMGVFTEMRRKETGELMRVPTKQVRGRYEFKPYAERKAS